MGRHSKQYDNNDFLKIETRRQRAYLTALETMMTTIATGPPGTGKTYMATVYAHQALKNGDFKRLVIARPAKGTEDDIGFEPGDMNEKMAGWVRPVSETLIKLMGTNQYQDWLGSTIELVPLHQLMGRSFDNSFIIVDEAQNMTIATAMSLVTRIGTYSKLVLCGDVHQQVMEEDSGLAFLLELIENHHLPVNHIQFEIDDCVRSKECKMWLQALAAEGLI